MFRIRSIPTDGLRSLSFTTLPFVSDQWGNVSYVPDFLDAATFVLSTLWE